MTHIGSPRILAILVCKGILTQFYAVIALAQSIHLLHLLWFSQYTFLCVSGTANTAFSLSSFLILLSPTSTGEPEHLQTNLTL